MQTIWLSHPLTEQTPLYGGGQGIEIRPDKSIADGDSCNTTHLRFPAHSGTHVDTPRHFVGDGRNLDDIAPGEWIFNSPQMISVNVEPGTLIGAESIASSIDNDSKSDLLLIFTGFERYRGEPLYWQNSPGLKPELADFFSSRMSRLRAIGIDFISISSLAHRETGRAAHQALLGKDLLLFEDMALAGIADRGDLKQVIALPLRIAASDGVPCSLIGLITP